MTGEQIDVAPTFGVVPHALSGTGASQHQGDRACYLPAVDRIQLPDRASFHSPAAFCANWAHEQIHPTGHESRLKRDLGGVFRKPRYAREELVAEFGAMMVVDRQRDRETCRLSRPYGSSCSGNRPRCCSRCSVGRVRRRI